MEELAPEVTVEGVLIPVPEAITFIVVAPPPAIAMFPL